MASNNWVIHGNYTADGVPLLANDPHLGTSLPAVWVLNELVWGEKYAMGATLMGVPGVSIGRTKDMSWGITTPIGDNSDLWAETLNEDETKYFVDGEWRDLQIEEEFIEVKGQKPFKYSIKRTHRGAVFDFETLSFNAAVLFGGNVPEIKDSPKYSLAWSADIVGDQTITFSRFLQHAKTVPEVFEFADKLTAEEGYMGLPLSIVFADTEGNIGYMMMLS